MTVYKKIIRYLNCVTTWMSTDLPDELKPN